MPIRKIECSSAAMLHLVMIMCSAMYFGLAVAIAWHLMRH